MQKLRAAHKTANDFPMVDLYGLIGKTLKHSFSQKYFRSKFEREKIANCDYLLYEMEDIAAFPNLIRQNSALKGLNVTIPYKQAVIPFLDKMDEKAKAIGAVNTIRFEKNNLLIGYNTDYLGFKISLEQWLRPPFAEYKALVLGTGGASKAIKVALETLGIAYLSVSRTAQESAITYETLWAEREIVATHQLIINTTPLGTYPNVDEAPEIPYETIGAQHYFYDLVYNPTETQFLKYGKERGAKTKNGLEMLEIQAEKAWEIWNS